MKKEDEDQVSPMAAAMLVLQERSRAKAQEGHASPKAAFLWGVLAATAFFTVALLVGYLIFVNNAEREPPLANKSAAPAAAPQRIPDEPVETAPGKPSQQSPADTPPGKLSDAAHDKTADKLRSSSPAAEKSGGEAARQEQSRPRVGSCRKRLSPAVGRRWP